MSEPRNGSKSFDDTKPRHKHNCDKCDFIGVYWYEGEWGDLYFCNVSRSDGDFPSVVFRTGNRPGSYTNIFWNPFLMSSSGEFLRRVFDDGCGLVIGRKNNYRLAAALRVNN